mmetsp:Transcript_1704/g.2132  ORF Transcript_1704/g.2132 Transcript_1704/m.2132 type:complete len:89 (-) Transcript_1704:728-994(-)
MLMQFLFSLVLVGSLFSAYAIFINTYAGTGNSENCEITLQNYPLILIRLYWVILFVFIIFAVTKPLDKSRFIYTTIVLIFSCLMMVVF